MLRLEPAMGLKTCSFCSRAVCDDIKYGQLLKLGDEGMHQFCLFLSWNVTHYCSPSNNVTVFDQREVNRALEESRNYICVYCEKGGATLRCFNLNCDKKFHFPCGLENDSMHLFFKRYETYCSEHRIVQQVPSDLETQESMMCAICQDGITGKVSPSTLWASCCAKQTWFHRDCVQRHAFHAGYELRCPCCNDEAKFKEEMRKQGIRITNERPTWLGGRLVSLPGIVSMCAASSCNCPNGPYYSNQDRWLLRPCVSCAVRRIHRFCGVRGRCGQCHETSNNGDNESMVNHPPGLDDFEEFQESNLDHLLEPETFFRRLMGMPVAETRSVANRNAAVEVNNFEDEDMVRRLFTDDIADNITTGSDSLGLAQTASLGITDLLDRVMIESQNNGDNLPTDLPQHDLTIHPYSSYVPYSSTVSTTLVPNRIIFNLVSPPPEDVPIPTFLNDASLNSYFTTTNDNSTQQHTARQDGARENPIPVSGTMSSIADLMMEINRLRIRNRNINININESERHESTTVDNILNDHQNVLRNSQASNDRSVLPPNASSVQEFSTPNDNITSSNEMYNGQVTQSNEHTVAENIDTVKFPCTSTLPSPSFTMRGNAATGTSGPVRRGFMNSRVIINSPLERTTSITSSSSNLVTGNTLSSTYTPLPTTLPSFLRDIDIEASSPNESVKSRMMNTVETDERQQPIRLGVHPINANGRRATAPLPSFLRNRQANAIGTQVNTNTNSIPVDERFRRSMFDGRMIPPQVTNPTAREFVQGPSNESGDGTNGEPPLGRRNLSGMEHFNMGMAVGMGIMYNERDNTSRNAPFNNDRHLDNHHHPSHPQHRRPQIPVTAVHIPAGPPPPLGVIIDEHNTPHANGAFGNYSLLCVECGHPQGMMVPQYYPTVTVSPMDMVMAMARASNRS